VQYVTAAAAAAGCHVTSGLGGGGKRGGAAYCDCAAAWPPPASHDLVHRSNLVWQTAADETSPKFSGGGVAARTVYCRHTTSGCAWCRRSTSGCAPPPPKSTPDLFVDSRPEAAPMTSSADVADTIGRAKTSAHLYESPAAAAFAHTDRRLLR